MSKSKRKLNKELLHQKMMVDYYAQNAKYDKLLKELELRLVNSKRKLKIIKK